MSNTCFPPPCNTGHYMHLVIRDIYEKAYFIFQFIIVYSKFSMRSDIGLTSFYSEKLYRRNLTSISGSQGEHPAAKPLR